MIFLILILPSLLLIRKNVPRETTEPEAEPEAEPETDPEAEQPDINIVINNINTEEGEAAIESMGTGEEVDGSD